MQHDLEQRHEGGRQPRDLPIAVRSGGAALGRALVLGAALVLQGCAAAEPIVMASGRDDHGLVERPALGLQRSPTDTQLSGSIQDGRFARIVRTEGPWRYIRAIQPPDGEGWIEDHYLRGEAARTDVTPPRVVRFAGAELRDGKAWIRVRDAQSGAEEWVPASALREIGAR